MDKWYPTIIIRHVNLYFHKFLIAAATRCQVRHWAVTKVQVAGPNVQMSWTKFSFSPPN